MRILAINNAVWIASLCYVSQAAFACGDAADLEGCVGEHHKKSDLALNQQYQLSMKSLPLELKGKLKTVEMLWLDYRKDVCGGLNALDRLGCESSLMDQRTQELYFIERRFSQETGHGVYELISKRYGGGADSEILSEALKMQVQKETWSVYSSSHCDFVREVIGESVESCKIRLILESWNGFR
ncbi:lysozyme inhibitor LprI family protein [Pseudomonas nitroreducens]|uniref:lysozyme inhibitor LprI family protein n=1 Tax=Pseudomonas TaxID=286 RepID=UPI0009DA4483|nr:lysozyme inhibitor LprI family protein [Pseudomonas nitroreducens]